MSSQSSSEPEPVGSQKEVTNELSAAMIWLPHEILFNSSGA